jgi:hypothetical protein
VAAKGEEVMAGWEGSKGAIRELARGVYRVMEGVRVGC